MKALEVKINTNVKSLYVYCQTGGKKKKPVKYQKGSKFGCSDDTLLLLVLNEILLLLREAFTKKHCQRHNGPRVLGL